MLGGQHMSVSAELLNKKQIFSLFFLCEVGCGKYTAWGFHYPAYSFGYQLTQPATPQSRLLILATMKTMIAMTIATRMRAV